MTLTVERRECATHGAYDAQNFYGSRWSQCPACAKEQAQRDRENVEAGLRRERQDSLLARSGLDGRYRDATFANFVVTSEAQRKVHTAVQDFVDDFRPDSSACLWLIGTPGTGKTHLLAAAVHSVIERFDRPSSLTTPQAIVRRLRTTWRRNSDETEQDVIRDFATEGLLALDEAGMGYGTDGERMQLFDVVDARYVRRAPLILSSNLNVQLLQQALGDRLFDRLREGARVYTCTWPSHRKPASA